MTNVWTTVAVETKDKRKALFFFASRYEREEAEVEERGAQAEGAAHCYADSCSSLAFC